MTQLYIGLIPAHAGKTRSDHGRRNRSRAHPRSRGENISGLFIDAAAKGSSPLTRGKPRGGDRGQHGRGLIPAHAGKTSPPARRGQAVAAHPRSRGENGSRPGAPWTFSGSSPLTRGKPRRRRRRSSRRRLIPAHAGKTAGANCAANSSPAHPRSRGENDPLLGYRRGRGGSSPLTRGKRRRLASPTGGRRLIPAHAGKTRPGRRAPGPRTAHPRSRGENRIYTEGRTVPGGSSPLTRGKLPVVQGDQAARGLIPAHAGKTLPDLRFYRADRSDLGKP